MTTDQIEAERVAFEAWAEFAHEENIHVARVALCTRNGQYVSAFTACLWQGWLARADLIHAERQAAEELIDSKGRYWPAEEERGHDATPKTP